MCRLLSPPEAAIPTLVRVPFEVAEVVAGLEAAGGREVTVMDFKVLRPDIDFTDAFVLVTARSNQHAKVPAARDRCVMSPRRARRDHQIAQPQMRRPTHTARGFTINPVVCAATRPQVLAETVVRALKRRQLHDFALGTTGCGEQRRL